MKRIECLESENTIFVGTHQSHNNRSYLYINFGRGIDDFKMCLYIFIYFEIFHQFLPHEYPIGAKS